MARQAGRLGKFRRELALTDLAHSSTIPDVLAPVSSMTKLPPTLRRTIAIVSTLAAVVVLVIGVSLFSIYEASQLVPEFYHEAVSREPDDQAEARDQFVAQATALASDLNASGRWQSLFTADQINAWLALELRSHYPELLPAEMREPRLALNDHEATIACRYTSGDMAAVLSLSVDVYLDVPNVLALRIRRARAGALPVPMTQVLDSISRVASQLELRLEWRKIHGDPVALIHFAGKRGDAPKFDLQTVEVRDGALFLAGINHASPGGTPEPEQPSNPTAQNDEPDQPLVGSAEKETVQK